MKEIRDYREHANHLRIRLINYWQGLADEQYLRTGMITSKINPFEYRTNFTNRRIREWLRFKDKSGLKKLEEIANG